MAAPAAGGSAYLNVSHQVGERAVGEQGWGERAVGAGWSRVEQGRQRLQERCCKAAACMSAAAAVLRAPSLPMQRTTALLAPAHLHPPLQASRLFTRIRSTVACQAVPATLRSAFLEPVGEQLSTQLSVEVLGRTDEAFMGLFTGGGGGVGGGGGGLRSFMCGGTAEGRIAL